MRSFVLMLLLLTNSVFAAPFATVTLLKGDVTYEGKSLKEGDTLKTNGLLKVGAKSVAKLKVEDYNSVMTFAPNSEMKLTFKKDEYSKSPYTLVRGGVRWLTQGKARYKGVIQTNSAVMGVRGTDFLALANPVFGESEIVCFDGKVLLQNKKMPSNQWVISKGQWGGIGGRYGKTIEKPLDLPKGVVKQMKDVIGID